MVGWGVASWGRRDCGGNLPMICDEAFESLADTSARFVHFREVLRAMEIETYTNVWAAEILLYAHAYQGSTDVAEGRTQPHSYKSCAP